MSEEPSAPTEGPRPVLLAFCGAVLVLAGLQFVTPNLIGNDSYFHIRYAEVLRQAGVRGFPPPFPWLPLTILAPDRYADHHMLFHVWLVPFTLGDLRLGGKLAGLAGATAFVAAFTWFLRREGVGLLPLAILALGASSADLLFRLDMTRVQALSLVCLLAGFHCALHDRRVALAVVGCLYAWLYDGFPLLFLPVGATVAARWISRRSTPYGHPPGRPRRRPDRPRLYAVLPRLVPVHPASFRRQADARRVAARGAGMVSV